MKEILVIAEHRKGEIRPVTYELLNLSASLGGETTCVVMGNNIKGMAEDISRKADEVIIVDHEILENFNSELYWSALEDIIKEREPDIIAMGHTAVGMELAPFISEKINAPLATDIVKIEDVDGKIHVHKYVFSNKLLAEFELKESQTYVITIRQGEFKEEVDEKSGKIEERSFTPPDSLSKRFLEYVEPEEVGVDISKAEIIVSVGRGIEDEGNIELAEELAEILNGVVAGSRPVIDSGWLSKERQVGISGKTVKPKLYLALGISGAFQHIVGMKDSDLIIAINRDPEAPIFQVAHYGVIGDIFDVVPELIERLRK